MFEGSPNRLILGLSPELSTNSMKSSCISLQKCLINPWKRQENGRINKEQNRDYKILMGQAGAQLRREFWPMCDLTWYTMGLEKQQNNLKIRLTNGKQEMGGEYKAALDNANSDIERKQT